MRAFLIFVSLCLSCSANGSTGLSAADIDELPKLPTDDRRPTQDWLIDGSPFEAGIYRTDHVNEIVLDNGLIRRTFRIAPNAATVGFDNLMTGQSIIRGVKPEAMVQLNGVSFQVGGLTGQPNYAYLLPQWLNDLKSDPRSFQFVGFEVSEPQQRFGWKRVRHHAPLVKWPPEGVCLRMDFEAPSEIVRTPGTPQSSGDGRSNLFSEDFDKLSAGWKVHASKSHERCSFENEGKTGEIFTPANTSVYVERDLPKGTRLVETLIDVGTDRSASWGPGLGLVFKDRTIKFYIRPGGDAGSQNSHLAAFYSGAEHLRLGDQKPIDVSKPWSLRIRMEESLIFLDARPTDGDWSTVQTIDAAQFGEPIAVRVGKMDRVGGSSDFSGEKGDLVRLHILRFSAFGDLDESVLAAREAEIAHLKQARVSVHYELYDHVPVISKWITVSSPDGTETSLATSKSKTGSKLTVDRFASEVLAVVEQSNWVEKREGVVLPRPDVLHVETDMAFGGFQAANANEQSVHWRPDPQFSTQVNYLRETPCLLVVEPKFGPAQDVPPNKIFESFRTFELVYDSTDRDRRGLTLKRMYRTLAPWVTENPLMMHMRTADPNAVQEAIQQCADVGFEMLILSFGSGFNIENDSPEYLQQCRELAGFAKEKGIEIGGYSLLASRRIGGGNDVVAPPGESPTFGNCPALTSDWGQDYFRKLYEFYQKTGFMLLEHDGSYPGDRDVTKRLPLQKGADDSQWVQWRIISNFYKWCRGNGIYLNVPDYYYLTGSNKCGMGYREVNWSLPRAQQVIHTRQNIFDGTWKKTPSMGWMFVPLTQYHGGGAAATIEPLDEHRDHYEKMLTSNLAMGVQACYRGPRLYDTNATREMVAKWVAWFKKYRDILESDVVHGRRADGRDLDWMLHANPQLDQKGMLVVFNPLMKTVEKTLKVNVYYTGLTDQVRIREKESLSKTVKIARDYSIDVPVKVGPEFFTWFVLE